MKKIRNKLLLALILVTLLPAILISAYSLFSTSKALRANVLSEQQNKVSLLRERINNYVSSVPSDLFFLKDSNALSLYTTSQSESGNHSQRLLLTNLRSAFRKFSEQKEIYSQVRYLDKEGKEIVRVDRLDGKSKTISDTKLQDKSDRYYFKDAIALEEDQLYISDFDLNKESGEIQKPTTPTLRYATPVFDKEDKLTGVVVLNVDGNALLGLIAKQATDGQQLLFTNTEGYYYFHNDMSKTWGGANDLASGINIYKDRPDVVDQLKEVKALDYVESDQEILIYNPITVNNGKKVMGRMFSVVPKDVLFKPLQNYFWVFFGIALVSLIAAFTLASLLSNSITKPLVDLKDKVENLSKGDMETPIEIKAKDEVGELSHAVELLRKSMSILMTRSR